MMPREEDLKKFYDTPANKRLKYFAIASIVLGLAMHLINIILVEKLSLTAFHILRIAAGFFVVLFGLLLMVLVYRVHSAYWRSRRH